MAENTSSNKPPHNIVFSVAPSLDKAVSNFVHALEFRAKASIYSRGSFKIGVSGGSLIKTLAEDVLPRIVTDFSKWKIFFCDERMVPYDHPESTYGLYKAKLVGKFPGLTENTFVSVDTSLPVAEAAKDYEAKLRSHFPYEFADPLPAGQTHFPRFDCLLLGLGPDGHTCSLFPDHPLMKEKNLWVAPISDSPKPPPERVTITFPVIHKARNIKLFLTGSGKADILKRILVDCERLPGFFINATEPNCEVEWLLDEPAGALIPEPEIFINKYAEEFQKWTSCTPRYNPTELHKDEDVAY